MSLGQPGLYGKYQADESYLDLSQNTREEERGKEGARGAGREREDENAREWTELQSQFPFSRMQF